MREVPHVATSQSRVVCLVPIRSGAFPDTICVRGMCMCKHTRGERRGRGVFDACAKL